MPGIDVVDKLAWALCVSPIWLAFGPEGDWPFQKKQPRPLLPYEDPEPIPGSLTFQARFEGCGERLRQMREQLGWSLRRLADEIAEKAKVKTGRPAFKVVKFQAILLIETGVTVPGLDTVEAIANALGVAPGWLAYGDEEGE